MFVITAPTSNIGRQLVQKLLDSNKPLRLIARDVSRLPAAIRQRVEVVEGSHGEAHVVNEAFKGAEAVFWLPPPNAKAASLDAVYLDFTRPACEALRTHQVKRVVGVSALGRGLNMKAGHVTASLAMDDLLASTGVNYRALVMPSFMDNILRQVGAIKSQGMMFGPQAADRKVPTCASQDIATVAARLLLDGKWTGHGSAAVLGPEDLSPNDMAQTVSEVLGKPVRFQQIPLDAFKARMLDNGASEAMAQGLVDMARAKNEGLDNGEPRTAENTTPTSFRQWCQQVLKPAVEG